MCRAGRRIACTRIACRRNQVARTTAARCSRHTVRTVARGLARQARSQGGRAVAHRPIDWCSSRIACCNSPPQHRSAHCRSMCTRLDRPPEILSGRLLQCTWLLQVRDATSSLAYYSTAHCTHTAGTVVVPSDSCLSPDPAIPLSLYPLILRKYPQMAVEF